MIADPLGLLLDAYERHGPVFSLRILNARNVFMLGRALEARGPRLIQTVRGRGYLLGDPPPPAAEEGP